MEKTMLDIFMEKVQSYPRLNGSQISNIKNIFMLDEGIYVIDKAPSVDVIKEFSKFKGEFSILLINNVWFFTVSYKKEAYIPVGLSNYITKGLVQFFAHSHPDEGNTATLFPSFSDLESSDAIDHKIYIISVYGITEVDITDAHDFKNLNGKWESYILDKHITYQEYMENQFKIYMNFMEFVGCKLRVISFDNLLEIENILNSKQMLQHEFWSRRAGITSYPGKKH